MDFSMPDKQYEFKFVPSTIEDIDLSVKNYIDKTLNLHTITNEGMKKVPVLWLGTERSYQIKNNSDIRTTEGELKMPLITIERSSLEKDKTFKGAVQAHLQSPTGDSRSYRNGVFRVISQINQEKTRNFQSAEAKRKKGQPYHPHGSKKIVYDVYYVPLPVYVKAMYSINLRTEYQQQMNNLVTPFISTTGQINHFLMRTENHTYEGFIEASYDQSNNLSSLGEEERKFETKVTIKVLGYIHGDGSPNEERPKVIKKETIVEISLPRERVILEDEIPWIKKDNKYRR